MTSSVSGDSTQATKPTRTKFGLVSHRMALAASTHTQTESRSNGDWREIAGFLSSTVEAGRGRLGSASQSMIYRLDALRASFRLLLSFLLVWASSSVCLTCQHRDCPMTSHHDQPRANKARVDSRRGMLAVTMTHFPVSTRMPAPAVTGLDCSP